MWRILKHSFAGLVRSLKIILHQFMSLFFFMLGFSAAAAAWKEYKDYTPEIPSSGIRFYTSAGFAVLLLTFAVSSLLRARAVKKKQ
ncbi:MAG: hypothetical protein LAO31_07875 [Acidobacteriia bacterium]|nr:hypothetical protein [Terriglobia bacterium]